MSPSRRSPVRVFGVGHPDRGDDAAGLWVARRLRGHIAGVDLSEVQGDPLAMIPAWEGARLAIVVDAMCAGLPPGTIRCFDATRGPVPAAFATATSTHGFGVPEAIELARSLGRLPERLVVVGIEAASFVRGAGPGPEVRDGVVRATRRVARACRKALPAHVRHHAPGVRNSRRLEASRALRP